MSYLRTYHPRPQAPLRLVFLPHAGGVATAFRGLGGALPSWIEPVCVQYPGRQDRGGEPFVTDLVTLADEIVGELPAQAHRALALFGHSMGATVAFEVARRTGPVHLFLSGPSSGRDQLTTATDEQLLAEVKRLGGAGVTLLDHPEIKRLALPAIRSDLTMFAAHEIAQGAVLDCPITVLAGEDDHVCSAEDAKRWAERTTAEFDLRFFPGGHHYFEDAGEQIAALLAGRLRRHVEDR